MIYLIKTGIVFFLLAWIGLGVWLVAKYTDLFGPHRDDPAETVGARSFGVTHIAVVWLGFFIMGLCFLFR